MRKEWILAGVVGVLLSGAAFAQDDASGVPAPAEDDEFMEVLGETGPAWMESDLGEVKSNLDYLGQLYGQRRVALLALRLPAPLDDWEAGEIETQVMGAALMGGATSVKRTYTMGSESVTVEIIGDNAMLMQGLNMMLNNPMMIQSSNGEMLRIDGENAIYQNDELKFMVEKWLVQITGSGSKENKVAYGEAIDEDDLGDFE